MDPFCRSKLHRRHWCWRDSRSRPEEAPRLTPRPKCPASSDERDSRPYTYCPRDQLTFHLHQDTLTTFRSAISHTTITQLLEQAQAILLELDQIVNYQIIMEIKHSVEAKMVVNRLAWLREERHVCRLQDSLRVARLDIAAALAAFNLYVSVFAPQVNVSKI